MQIQRPYMVVKTTLAGWLTCWHLIDEEPFLHRFCRLHDIGEMLLEILSCTDFCGHWIVEAKHLQLPIAFSFVDKCKCSHYFHMNQVATSVDF